MKKISTLFTYLLLFLFISCKKESEIILLDSDINPVQTSNFVSQNVSSLIFEFRDSLSSSGYNIKVIRAGKPLWSFIYSETYSSNHSKIVLPIEDSISHVITNLLIGIKSSSGRWYVKLINKDNYNFKKSITNNKVNKEYYSTLLNEFETAKQFYLGNEKLEARNLEGTYIVMDNGWLVWFDADGRGWIIDGTFGSGGNGTGSTIWYGKDGSVIWRSGNNNGGSSNGWDDGEDSGFNDGWDASDNNIDINGGGSGSMDRPVYDILKDQLGAIELRNANKLAQATSSSYQFSIPIQDFWNRMNNYSFGFIEANLEFENGDPINRLDLFENKFKEAIFLKEIGYPLNNQTLSTPAIVWLSEHNAVYEFIANNYLSNNDKVFAKWSVTFFLDHPSTTIAQFDNWFISEVAGYDGEYDASYWNNPNLTFPPQILPSWINFEAAFPKNTNGSDMSIDAIYELVNGDVKKAKDKYNLEMGCALKLSIALNYCKNANGVPYITIPYIPTTATSLGTVKGADNKYYFLNAEAMNSWMRKVFGCANPNTAIGEYANTNALHWIDDVLENYDDVVGPYLKANSIKGIFSIVARQVPFRASGHCDILRSDGTCLHECYFDQAGAFKYIDVWKLQ